MLLSHQDSMKNSSVLSPDCNTCAKTAMSGITSACDPAHPPGGTRLVGYDARGTNASQFIGMEKDVLNASLFILSTTYRANLVVTLLTGIILRIDTPCAKGDLPLFRVARNHTVFNVGACLALQPFPKRRIAMRRPHYWVSAAFSWRSPFSRSPP